MSRLHNPPMHPSKRELVASKLFPVSLGGTGTLMCRVSRTDFFGEVGEIMAQVFSMNLDPSSSLSNDPQPREIAAMKRDLYDEFWGRHSEYFVVRRGTEVVGWATGEMFDEETFYCRNGGVISEFRRVGLMQELFSKVIEYLSAIGYARLLLNHLTTNRNMAVFVLKQGFYINGIVTDERWGTNMQTALIIDNTRRTLLERSLGPLPVEGISPKLTRMGSDSVVWPPTTVEALDKSGFLNVTVGDQGTDESESIVVFARPHDRAGLVRLINAGFLPTGYQIKGSNDCWVSLARSTRSLSKS